jgi:hypothetical protein
VELEEDQPDEDDVAERQNQAGNHVALKDGVLAAMLPSRKIG